jgi:hypothetical protein
MSRLHDDICILMKIHSAAIRIIIGVGGHDYGV